LLKVDDNISFDLTAQRRLNLGIRFVLAVGGASFEELDAIFNRYRDVVDLEWLLPALARTGGARALPILQAYRADGSIIPLGNYQNIRAVPCAAVLGCAYAGDAAAFETILKWYEEDTISQPRFAFSIQWGIGEGIKPDYRLLDFCEHRMLQAERLFAFRGASALPGLIERANRDLPVSLIGYLTRRIDETSGVALSPFAALLEHPCAEVKQHVLAAFLERGTSEDRAAVLGKVGALATSARGTDRLFAAEAGISLDPVRRPAILQEALRRETNPAVRRRIEMLEPRR
jgi:hypothetical protein